MKPKPGPNVKVAVKIAAALALSLLGMALLPLLALPYGSLDWVAYDPAYKAGHSFPTPAPPAARPTPQIPCAELPAPDAPLAARVNGQGIGLAAFEREMAQFLAVLEAAGNDLQDPAVQAELPGFQRQVLDLLIDDVLVQQAAVKLGLAVTDEQIQVRVSQEISQSGGIEWFEGWLAETGQTWAEYERDICQELLRQQVSAVVTAGVGDTAEMVHARQIVVSSVDGAWKVLTRLASGEDLSDLAKEMSLDESSREQGGDLGWLPRGLGWLAPQVEEAAFSGEPGEVQGPIQVGDRYVIVQTLEHQADRPLDPASREALRAIAFEQWMGERREAAEIEIYVTLN